MNINFNDLNFKTKKQEQDAKDFKNCFNEDIITASVEIIKDYLYYGYYFNTFKKQQKTIINILGLNNCKKIYNIVVNTISND